MQVYTESICSNYSGQIRNQRCHYILTKPNRALGFFSTGPQRTNLSLQMEEVQKIGLMFDVLIYLKRILDCSTFTNHSLPLRSLQEKKTRIYIRLLSIGTPHLARIGNFPFFFLGYFLSFFETSKYYILKHQNNTCHERDSV